MLYFAYGSNLDWSQMKERCPSACFVGKAVLKGYRFDFTRRSINRSCGVMDIVQNENEQVWGVIYQIDERDLINLDKSEGYSSGRQKNAYRRIGCVVYIDGETDNPITAMTYEVIEKSTKTIFPNHVYKSLIVNGAIYWDLPESYLNRLNLIKMQD